MPVNSFENYPMSWKPEIDKRIKPIYMTLANQLEQDVLNGTLLPGTKLPPQRELADFLDMNVSTVSKAFKVCELKGLLSATVGRGTYVSYDALSNNYLLPESKSKNIIDMGVLIPDTSSEDYLTQQLRNMVKESNFGKQFRYQNDLQWQKDAAVSFMKKSGYDTTLNSIHFANGGQNAIMAALLGLCQHGDKIGIDTHIYSGVKTAASMLGIQLLPIKWDDGGMSEEALIQACKQENLKGIYLIPDYQNPTTQNMSLSRRKSIAQIAKDFNIFIIEDAIFPLMRKEREKSVATFAPEQTIYITSFSKAVAPGLRLAYLLVPEQYKKSIVNALYNLNLTVSPLMLELASRVVVSGTLDKIIHVHQQNTIIRNQLVNKYFAEYNCCGEDTCIFRWLQLPSCITGAEFESLALERGVQVYAAERFTVGNSVPEKAVRLSIGAPETIEELEQGLKILQQLLMTFY